MSTAALKDWPPLGVISELLLLPLAPFIELVHALATLQLEEAQAVGIGTAEDRALLHYQRGVEELLTARNTLLRDLQAGHGLLEGPSALRALAQRGRAFARSFGSFDIDLGLRNEILNELEGYSRELEREAWGLEKAIREAQGTGTAPDVPLPDPGLLTALDRFGWNLDDLAALTQPEVERRYRERARRFHPDGKDEADRVFFEEEMKKLNAAKELLLQHLQEPA